MCSTQCFGCVQEDINWITCNHKDFRKNYPIKQNKQASILDLRGVQGTIYSDTLSQLPQIKDIYLFYSDLDSIEKGALCKPPYVESITFSRSRRLPHITSDIFEGCQKVKQIRFLNNNHLSFGVDTFKNLGSLINLVLFNNTMPDLTWDEFGYLENLKLLDVSNNNLRYIDIEKVLVNMPKLQKLKIDGNLLTCAEMLEIKQYLDSKRVMVRIEENPEDLRCGV